ncbi:UDP-glycosyltransferase 92A1 isoform X1 [Prunus yedoensis var. nudiflora]|uniref:UDP-glycosyltransferase 92A1 isoform X1 n=1 Tax=Prunus yedoensis var. nudiflora TaxID=2094558 RepID=A0A314UMJ8_PRUYE|nr:UDP-glycosyltransferase 92A1 isoform X1 [Prunus yedoensis var. nudiflora]
MGFDREHIVMLPLIAKGHLIPFLALAKQIQQKTGFTITIATTPLNIQYLKATISSTSSSSNTQSHSKIFDINLAELPFYSSDFGRRAGV